MYCISYCIGQHINLSGFERAFKQSHPYPAERKKNVLKLSIQDKGTLFFFENGTVVSWKLKRYQTKKWLELAKTFTTQSLNDTDIVMDEFHYSISDTTSIRPHDYFNIDCLTLEKECDDIKLSISYGLSQSVKLNYFEIRLEKLIKKSIPMMQAIKKNSFKSVSRKELHLCISEQLLEKSELNLVSNFLYQPGFFWQHPGLESFFHLIEEYTDIKKRISTVNKRLDILNEIHDVVLSHNDTQHSSRLEVIIIVLIMIEIVCSVLNLHF